ncbi:hypothetical protein ABZ725_29745 [Streptomyces sp. NPDC006872]|uniref:hypothetical protein n=1 Tax=Streptomyces sp. NPDC006872 TaxID=3155720 RepID=UPI0033CB53AE
MDQGWAAIAGAGVGVLGAVMTGLVAAAGLRRQSRDQLAGTHAQWRRQLRRDAYAAFLAAAHRFQTEARALSPALGSDQSSLVERGLQVLGSAEGLLLERAQDVDLEGPDFMVQAMHPMLATAKQIVVDATIWLELAGRSDPGTAQIHMRFAEHREDLANQIAVFRDAARQDLQAP